MQMVTSKSYRNAFTKKLVQAILSNPFNSQAGVIANLPQPPFPHLLRSNTPPATESEIFLIRDTITMAEEEELRLEEMASNHTGSSHRLTLKTVRMLTGRIRQFIIEHNAILSFIRRIPPEILQNIFIHTLPSPTTTTATTGSRVSCISQLPWALSQVCQLWRITILSFSVMWRDLPVVDLRKAHTKKEPYLDLLTELLKRSHNMPINLTIMRGSSADIGHPVIETLLLHSDRWQEIKIHGSSSVLCVLERIKDRLSSLQSLHLHLPYFHDHEIPIPDPVDYAVHVSPRFLPRLLVVDFHGLRLPDLIVLRLDTDFYHLFPIHKQFFNNTTTPALEELALSSKMEATPGPICSLILRSGCLLKVLELKINFAPGELQSIFRLTPLVTKLTITFPPIQDIFALVFDGNTPPLLPLLKECEFTDFHGVKFSTETVQALQLLASSRCELPSGSEFHPLQTLRISLNLQSISHRQYFEGWVDSDMTNKLYKLHRRLLVLLPELLRRNIPSSRKFDLKWKSKVTGLLTHLETLQVEKASDICISGLQYILYAISIGFNEGDVRFSFSLIAKRILEKWEPILRDEMPNIHWLSTASSLEYLPTTQNLALCSSPDAIKLFFYELDTNDISDDYYVDLYGRIALEMVHHIH